MCAMLRLFEWNRHGARAHAQGNSRAGKQLAMDDPRSGLLRELCDVVLASSAEARAKMTKEQRARDRHLNATAAAQVFFGENTPLVSTPRNGSLRYIEERLGSRYELTWMHGTADHLGFAHRRRRFFIVGRRRDFNLQKYLVDVPPEPLGALVPRAADEPPRVLPALDPHFKDRMHVVGNSVVPAMSLYALLRLARACPELPAAPARAPFVLDPALWPLPATAKHSPTLKRERLILETRSYALMPTPRSSNVGANNHLTERAAHDLCTFVRFERGTPNALRGKRMNMDWVDWLMGYKPGYSRTDAGSAAAPKVEGAEAAPAGASTCGGGSKRVKRVKREEEEQVQAPHA